MNKFYVIIPLGLLLIFIGFERNLRKQRAQEESARADLAVLIDEIETHERAEKQRLAAEDLQKRNAEREKLERERVGKKQRDYEALMADLRSQADARAAEAETLARDLANLSAQAAELHARKNAAERETFELARIVSLQRIDRRNADLEIQRATAVVASRLNESPWAHPTPPPSPSLRQPR